MKDLKYLLPKFKKGSIMMFDDITWFDHKTASEDSQCYEGWVSVVSNLEVCKAVEINNNMGYL